MAEERSGSANAQVGPARKLRPILGRVRNAVAPLSYAPSMLCGYARVSTIDQHPELQLDALQIAGCERTWTDHASGATLARPQWTALNDHLRAGDTIVVWRLDRLARSLRDLVATLDDLTRRQVGFRSLTESIDTSTPAGRFAGHIFGSLAEFERELIRQRTSEGMTAARARGQHLGRPRTLTDGRAEAAVTMLAGGMTHTATARALGVSRQALSRALALLSPTP